MYGFERFVVAGVFEEEVLAAEVVYDAVADGAIEVSVEVVDGQGGSPGPEGFEDLLDDFAAFFAVGDRSGGVAEEVRGVAFVDGLKGIAVACHEERDEISIGVLVVPVHWVYSYHFGKREPAIKKYGMEPNLPFLRYWYTLITNKWAHAKDVSTSLIAS